jgi:hypothetical protein
MAWSISGFTFGLAISPVGPSRHAGLPDDEHAVDALYSADRLDVVQRRLGFHLDQHADLLVRALRIVLDPPKRVARVVPATPRTPAGG